MKTKSMLGVGVLVGSGVAVGGRGVAVLVGGSGVGVCDGSGVDVGGTAVGVGGAGVAVKVGGSGVGVAVSTRVGVLDGLGRGVGVGGGVGVGVVKSAQPASNIADKTMPTATRMVRHDARAERWGLVKDD